MNTADTKKYEPPEFDTILKWFLYVSLVGISTGLTKVRIGKTGVT